MTGRVAGKVALITGGAEGIGRACALRLAEEGAHAVIGDINEKAGRAVAAEIQAAGGAAGFLTLDVTDEAAWEKTVSHIVGENGGLDILVNNAGITIIRSVTETTLEEWRNIAAINLDGVFLGTKHAMRVMKRGASVINISSILGITAVEKLSAYGATKGGVRLFSKAAALDGAKAGIRVNSVHPGYIHTAMMEDTCHRDYGSLEKGLAELGKLHPIGRVGLPKDIANGVLFLASDDASFITGTELVIDGGYTAI